MAKTRSKGPQQKQRAGVYTMMLIVAFIALCLGSAILYMQLNRYNWELEAGVPAVSLLTPGNTAAGGSVTV